MDYVDYVQWVVLAAAGVDPVGFPSCTNTDVGAARMMMYAYDQAAGDGIYEDADMAEYCGGYGWYTSAEDLAVFAAALHDDTLLEDSTRQLMTEDNLGWTDVNTDAGRGSGHRGTWLLGGKGSSAAVLRLPLDVDLAVVINTGGLDARQAAVDGFNRMYGYD
jgi:hypothetical protein